MSSPTARTLAELRKQGYVCQVVERWNAFARKRVDLLGCVDVVALKEGELIGVQCTSTPNQGARLAKIKETPAARLWLTTGARLVIHGWKKYAKRVDGRYWRLTEREVTFADFESERTATNGEEA